MTVPVESQHAPAPPSGRVRPIRRAIPPSASQVDGAPPPIPFDIEYTRDLGYGAIDYLKRVLQGGEPGGMVNIQKRHMVPLPFGTVSDPQTGQVRIRLVNVESSSYRVAREYMIRLDQQDLEDLQRLRPVAAAAGLTASAYRDRYGYLTAV